MHSNICEKSRTCKHCKKIFSQRCNVSSHQNICPTAKRNCSVCAKLYDSDLALRKHQRFCSKKLKSSISASESSANKKPRLFLYYCRTCNAGFDNRGSLFRHQGTQHGGNDGNIHEEFEPPDINDAELQHEYDANRRFILAPSRHSRDNSVYNFPTNDLSGGFQEIENQLENVFNSQVNAFRINLSFGLLLRNSASNQVRYFIPHTNETLFYTSEVVTSRRDLERVVERIQSIDIQDHIQNLKENSEWKAQMITNVNYNVTPTHFPLGAGINLPDFVLNKRSIISLHKNNLGMPYDDNLCMFRALYYHKHKKIDEECVLEYFALWKAVNNLTGTAQDFQGIQFSEIPKFEDTFEVAIKMFELKSKNS